MTKFVELQKLRRVLNLTCESFLVLSGNVKGGKETD